MHLRDADVDPLDPSRTAALGARASTNYTITINPAAMAAGTELSFGFFQLSGGAQQASFALIDSGSYSCTSTAPGPAGPPEGAQLLYGGDPGPARS